MTSQWRLDGLRRRTKIVATLGPASQTPQVVSQLIQNGMNIARLNFSHGTYEEHGALLHIVRTEAERLGRHIAVLQDLCGPKVRIGPLEGDDATIAEGTSITLKHGDGNLGNSSTLYVDAFDPAAVLRPGEKVLLADGQIELVAEQVKSGGVQTVVRSGGTLRSRSGIAVPDSRLRLPSLTPKDLDDVRWAVENKIDYIALSFVRTAQDVGELRQFIEGLGASIPIIAKVERAAALDYVNEIVEGADAVMVARGDLGLELPLERVPGVQKLIIDQANYRGTPVITATQMLRSMVRELRPTRAEVSDVCTAVRDGTDAVMLSEETAIGAHPVEAVAVLNRIVLEAEKEFHGELYASRFKGQDRSSVPDAVCYAATYAASKISAAAVVACTQTGATGRLMAKYRPQQPLFAVTTERKTLCRMALYWGVEPVLIDLPEECTTEDEITSALVAIRDQYGLKPGSRIVLTAGLRSKRTGTTNVMEIREIPRTA